MLNFKKLELEDTEIIRPYIQKSTTRLCDGTIGGIVMWRDYFETKYVIKDENLIFKVRYINGETAFTIPVGKDPQNGISCLAEYCKAQNLPLIFCNVSRRIRYYLKNNYKVSSVEKNRDWYDYLYKTQDMVMFKGKKFNGQRNHINKFKRLYPNYSFEQINLENTKEVKLFLNYFFRENPSDDETAKAEMEKVYEVFNNFKLYNMLGGIIRVDGNIAAISVGEIIGDTLFVHIEKGDRNFQGIYQIMVNEFAIHFSGNTRFINREEDVGNEGLRKSKLSYRPVCLLEKSNVEILL